jgi:DNA invertase Pin-like site-specific DNA recombinase
MKMKTFLYARVSTTDKHQDAENQLPEMRREVERQGWTLKREFIDLTSASGKKKREQFDEMLEACERHQADVLMIWALDRFSREGPLRTLLLIDRLSRAGVKVKSMREPWLDPNSPSYELLLPIFAWIAKQESMRLGERVKAGMERAREKGVRFGRPGHGADVAQIRRLRRSGASLRVIAARVGISEASVRRSLKMFVSLRQNGIKK